MTIMATTNDETKNIFLIVISKKYIKMLRHFLINNTSPMISGTTVSPSEYVSDIAVPSTYSGSVGNGGG